VFDADKPRETIVNHKPSQWKSIHQPGERRCAIR
jgi:hypothetical protein